MIPFDIFKCQIWKKSFDFFTYRVTIHILPTKIEDLHLTTWLENVLITKYEKIKALSLILK